MQPSIPAPKMLCDACPLNHPDLYRNLVESGFRVMDSQARSIAKAVSYRLAGSATTGVLVFIFGGHNLGLSAGAGAADMFLKIGLYFLHERMWNHIDFGRAKRPEYEI
jgi:adenylylsulfate kinase